MSGLQVIDVSNPASPQILGTANTPGVAKGVDLSGTYADVADGQLFDGLKVIDVSNPASPQIVGTMNSPGGAVDVAGSYAYVADESQGVQVIDISAPLAAQIVGSGSATGDTKSVFVSGDIAYITDETGMHALDVTDRTAPVFIGGVWPGMSSSDVMAGSDYLYLGTATGLRIYPLQCAAGASVSEETLVGAVALDPCAPNPFATETRLSYFLPMSGHARLSIFDFAGRELRILVDGDAEKGSHSAWWDGRAEDGKLLPTGLYFARLRCGDYRDSRKILIKR